MKIYLIFQLLIIISLISVVVNKKKKSKKKPKKNTLPNGLPIPDDVRPNYIEPSLFCESCKMVIYETVQELYNTIKESDIIYQLDHLCSRKKYKNYQHSPGDIKDGCNEFMSVYEEEVIHFLSHRRVELPKEELAKQFCEDHTQVCKEVEVDVLKNAKKIGNNENITVDGSTVNVQVNKKKVDEPEDVNDKNQTDL